jgi:hypothetical protein
VDTNISEEHAVSIFRAQACWVKKWNLVQANRKDRQEDEFFQGYNITLRWKVANLISNEVIGFFNLPNPSRRNMALRLTQPLTEMSTKNFPGG